MRPLTDDETKLVFSKLEKFVGRDGIKSMLSRPDETYSLRLHGKRVFYVSETQIRNATSFSRDKLVSLGTCVGKITHANRFHLTVHFLDVMAQFAKHKVWLKSSAEMSFLYGSHVTKVGIAKVSDGIPQYAGVVVFSSAATPVALGFGVAAQPSDALGALEPTAVFVLNQGDIGEWLRGESLMS